MKREAGMRERIVKKFIEMVYMILIISLFLFSCFYFLRGESSSVLLGEDVTLDVRKEYSLKEKGFLLSYFSSLKALFSLNWGETINGESVRDVVGTSLPVTLSLTFWSFVLSFPFSLYLSIRGGAKKGVSLFLSSLFLLLPSFFSSILLILLFSSLLKIFPVAGYTPLSGGFLSHIRTIFLPSLSLSFVSSAFLLRLFREGIKETMEKSYITYSRAKGMKEKNIVLKAALKPTLPLIISSSGEALVSVFASSTVVETVFALPGMGRALVKSALERDYSLSFVLVMVSVAIISLILFLSNTLIEIMDVRSGRENGKS